MKKVKLKDIANIYNGNSINARVKAEKYCFNVPAWNYIGTKDIDFDGTVNYDTGVKIPFEEKGFKIAPANCVFVCSEGGSAGKKTAHITQEVCFGNKLYAIVNNKNLFVSKYVYYYTRYREFFEQFKALMSGIIGGVSSKKFGEIEIPLLSLQKQQRIVEKIEELFSKLDKGVEELNKIKEQLKIYRQAVLKEAFKQYANHNIKFISDVCSVRVGIVIKPSQYYTTFEIGIKAFRSLNVKEFSINNKDWVYINEKGQKENERSVVRNGDVLVVRSGYPGTSCVVNEKYDGCNAIDILIAKPNKDIILSEYLCAYTNSPYGKKLVAEKKRGVAQAHLNVNGYSKLQIPVPSLKRQKEVVDRIDKKLSIIAQIEQTINETLQKAESLRQSILKQAFEGKLV